MEQIFRVILSLSISGGLVGLLILLFRPVTRRFFAKKWTYYLWLLLLVRLLVPIHGNINLMGQLSTMMAAADNRQMGVEGESESGNVEKAEIEKQAGIASSMESAEGTEEIHDVAVVENVERNETETGVSVASDDERKAGRRADMIQIAGIIWILGVFLTAVYRVSTYKSFVKGINSHRILVTDRRLLYKNAEIQTRLRLVKEVPLYESAAINTPMLIGFRKPQIVLPSKLLAEMAERENDIGLVLHHELIHYKRRDIWYKWLFQAALCVHWFNPLLYFFNRRFNVDCELACDEAMMAILSEDGRRIYGNVLLDVAEKNLPEENLVMHRNVPMMTLLEEKNTLKERLQGIAGYQKKGFIIGFCSALVLAAFVALAVVCGVAGVRADSGDVFMMRNESPGIVDRALKSISDISFEEPMLIDNSGNTSGNPNRIYDNDELIAGESEHDTWEASNYCGGGNSVEVGKFVLNGSDEVWIVHANKETTLDIFSMFDLRDGRFKFVWVKPDLTVQTLNESGGKKVDKITLPQGRNVIKMVGQKARVKDVSISYGGVIEEDVDGIYRDANQEYAYQVLEGKQPIDVSRLEGVCPYLEPEMVSILFQKAWKEGAVLSERNWMDLFIYSDANVAGQYLLEELERGGVEEFDSRMLIKIAPYMNGKDVSECFRYLLERGKVSESDLENIFVYSDGGLSARYLIEASKRDGANEFDGKTLARLSPRISSNDLTDLVLTLEKDELTFQVLHENIIPYLGEDQKMQCIYHYIDLGNVLTDSQLRSVRGYVSEGDFYRIIEYNGKNK